MSKKLFPKMIDMYTETLRLPPTFNSVRYSANNNSSAIDLSSSPGHFRVQIAFWSSTTPPTLLSSTHITIMDNITQHKPSNPSIATNIYLCWILT